MRHYLLHSLTFIIIQSKAFKVKFHLSKKNEKIRQVSEIISFVNTLPVLFGKACKNA